MNEDWGRPTDEQVAIEESGPVTDDKPIRPPTRLLGEDTPRCRLEGRAYLIGELSRMIAAAVSSIAEISVSCALGPALRRIAIALAFPERSCKVHRPCVVHRWISHARFRYQILGVVDRALPTRKFFRTPMH